MVTVPKVLGLTQAAATTAITEAKLTLGNVTQQNSNTVATGNVISQDPTSGSSAAEGSPVNLVISSGPPQGSVYWVISKSPFPTRIILLCWRFAFDALSTLS